LGCPRLFSAETGFLLRLSLLFLRLVHVTGYNSTNKIDQFNLNATRGFHAAASNGAGKTARLF
jgi:hypothetical protein